MFPQKFQKYLRYILVKDVADIYITGQACKRHVISLGFNRYLVSKKNAPDLLLVKDMENRSFIMDVTVKPLVKYVADLPLDKDAAFLQPIME